MQNQIQIFENQEFGKIRAVDIDGQPWFIGKDITKVLGYENGSRDINRHVDKADRRNYRNGTSEINNRGVTVINESGLYSLIISSQLPAAKIFTRWITSEVLPSIRKHGAYITDDTLKKMRGDSGFTDDLINRLADERAKNASLLGEVEQLTPKARYYDLILQCENAVQTSIIAKDYGMTCAAFNKLLHGLKIQYRIGDTWLLYKDHADKGYTLTRTYHINDHLSKIHTYWTQGGRRFLYDILKWYGIIPEVEKTAMPLIGGVHDFRS